MLKASFTSKRAMTVMVAAVSPAADSADHTINTLRCASLITIISEALQRLVWCRCWVYLNLDVV